MIDYADKYYERQVFQGEKIYADDQYTTFSKAEFLSLLGTDPNDIHANLESSTGDEVGYFMPRAKACNNNYYTGIGTGTKPVYDQNEVRKVTRPNNSFFSIKYLRPVVEKLPNVLAYLPRKYHKSGRNAGKLIMDDVEFLFKVFATASPQEFDRWYKHQQALHKKEIDKNDPDTITVPTKLVKKLKLADRKNYNRGRSGNMIVNKDKSEGLKRKREEDVRKHVERKVIDDKVWMPPEELLNEVNPNVNQMFVPAQNYLKAKQNYQKLNFDANSYHEATMRMPFDICMAVPIVEDRENAYNVAANIMIKNLSAHNITLPSYHEAIVKYGINN